MAPPKRLEVAALLEDRRTRGRMWQGYGELRVNRQY
jgi:hypothetical protein